MTHRILIGDDDLHIREVIRVALKRAGMTVVEARDGKEALTRFAADRPDLIILDIGMPEFDGLDVCREIRKSSDVPILFLSARDEIRDRAEGLVFGRFSKKGCAPPMKAGTFYGGNSGRGGSPPGTAFPVTSIDNGSNKVSLCRQRSAPGAK